MFIYHCWVEIEHTAHLTSLMQAALAYPEYRKRLLDLTNLTKSSIETKEYLAPHDLRIIEGSGGMITSHFSGMQNHYDSGPENAFALINESAPGSHGLLCIHNTEYEGMEHQYQIFKMVSNNITLAKDISFLLPDTL